MKTLPNKATSLLLFVLFLSLSFCSPKAENKVSTDPSKTPLKILSYDSMASEGGLGPWIQKKFLETHGVPVEFVVTQDLAGLLGKLKQEDHQKNPSKIDAVLGLTEFQYHAALEKQFLEEGQIFARSPYSIIVNTEKVKNYREIDTWEKAAQALQGKLFVQDPRLSNVGIGWMRTLYQFKLLSKNDAEKMQARVFPSWTASYGAFMEGLSDAVWSYRSSEAYHHCNAKEGEAVNYAALALPYPEQQEWVAAHKGSLRKDGVKKFIDFILSDEVQKEIPLKNWMYPAASNTPLPDCYNKIESLKDVLHSEKKVSWSEFSQWKDQWSL